MKLLGLDYGRKHIGVAFADGLLAEPLATFSLSEAPSKIQILLDTQRVEKIVIGSGDERLLPEIKSFIASFNTANLPVEYVDETLSSKDAIRSLLHTSQSRRQAKNHQVAAALILQGFLDR